MQSIDAFYEKKLTCIFCSEPFTSLRVRSRFSIPFQIDSDYCPHYRDGNYNPHFYYVNVCPECGFAFSEDFSEQFPRGTKEVLHVQITNQWTKRDFGQVRDFKQALETYKLAILAGSLKQEKQVVLAGLCLRLAWLYRTENNPEQERRFLGLALNAYEQSFLHSDFVGSSMSEIQVLYMVGELSRRMGNYPNAISYLAKAVEHKDAKVEPKISKRAREQWKIAVEENRQRTS